MAVSLTRHLDALHVNGGTVGSGGREPPCMPPVLVFLACLSNLLALRRVWLGGAARPAVASAPASRNVDRVPSLSCGRSESDLA